MIAWTGWELMNAEQDVDIRGKKLNGLKRLPLGSYVEGLISIKSPEQPNKVSTAKENEQMLSSLSRKRRARNWTPDEWTTEVN